MMVEIRRFVEAKGLISKEQKKNGMGASLPQKTKPNASLIHILLYIAST